MALTHTQAKVLGVLVDLGAAQVRTVRQMCGDTGLSETTTRKALRQLAYLGLAIGTHQSPPNWRSTDRGRRAFSHTGYRDKAGTSS
ncbi:hypothetical protein [Nocardia heshunensis]